MSIFDGTANIYDIALAPLELAGLGLFKATIAGRSAWGSAGNRRRHRRQLGALRRRRACLCAGREPRDACHGTSQAMPRLCHRVPGRRAEFAVRLAHVPDGGGNTRLLLHPRSNAGVGRSQARAATRRGTAAPRTYARPSSLGRRADRLARSHVVRAEWKLPPESPDGAYCCRSRFRRDRRRAPCRRHRSGHPGDGTSYAGTRRQ